jgi:hypothetical protein
LQLTPVAARDIPERQLADQPSLIEAIPLALGWEVGQAVRANPRLGPLPGLPLDRPHRSDGLAVTRPGTLGILDRLADRATPATRQSERQIGPQCS